MKDITPIIAVLLTVFFWGSSFPVMSFLLETSSPMILAAGRFSLAAILSLLWCIYNYKNKIDSLPKKKLSYKNILYLGNTMKEFYYIYNSSEFQDILQYSFAFNGYLDVTNSIKKQIQSKLLNKVKTS